MPKPCLSLRHLKTSKQYEGSILLFRHWFQWSDRTNLKAVVLHLQLLDNDQNTLLEGSFQLKKTAIRNYLVNGETGQQEPVYDSSVWVQLDDIVRNEVPAFFRYYTVEGTSKKSDAVTEPMSGIFEDLELLG